MSNNPNRDTINRNNYNENKMLPLSFVCLCILIVIIFLYFIVFKSGKKCMKPATSFEVPAPFTIYETFNPYNI